MKHLHVNVFTVLCEESNPAAFVSLSAHMSDWLNTDHHCEHSLYNCQHQVYAERGKWEQQANYGNVCFSWIILYGTVQHANMARIMLLHDLSV